MRIGRLLGALIACLAVAHTVAPNVQAIDFSDYHSPAQVDTIMSNLEATYSGLCQVITIGTSHEGRPIKALKISDNVAIDEGDEGDVVFIALHHAREWISVEMALYLAEQLLTRYSTDPQLQADVNNLEIWIIPVANPDGFAHTWNPTGYRYWRKNRRNNGDGTFGVDLNRNWGYEWGRDDGSSPNTWNDTYRGPFAWSEPEIVALRDFTQGLDNLKTLLTYHSFSQLFLRPWGYTTDDPPGEETLKQLAQRSIRAIQAVHGLTYNEEIGYTASGETTDYLWGGMRVSAFTPELQPASGGLSGFSPPPSTIIPNNEENLPAALALIHDAGSREVWIRDYPGDTGAEPSAVWTGSGWSHAFWVSPDIWTVPETLDQGATVDLHVRIWNNTGTTQNNVRVDVYWTDPRISLEFPNPDASLIGSRTITVPPGGTTVTMPWTVPVGTNSWGERHWCVGAVIMHETDMPLTTQAQRTSNIGIRNFNTTEVVVGMNLIVAATNFLDVDAELAVYIDRSALPTGWHVMLPEHPKRRPRPRPTAIERKAMLLKARGPLLQPGETIYLPIRVKPPKKTQPGQAFNVNVHAALIPLVVGKREAVGNGFTYRVVADPKDSPQKKRE